MRDGEKFLYVKLDSKNVKLSLSLAALVLANHLCGVSLKQNKVCVCGGGDTGLTGGGGDVGVVRKSVCSHTMKAIKTWVVVIGWLSCCQRREILTGGQTLIFSAHYTMHVAVCSIIRLERINKQMIKEKKESFNLYFHLWWRGGTKTAYNNIFDQLFAFWLFSI